MKDVEQSERSGRRFWAEFDDFIERHSTGDWIFRGVADAEKHRLVPKIGRAGGTVSGGNVVSSAEEEAAFEEFKRRCRNFIDTSGFDDWDYLSLAQHHGLPTRLLDWTTNPMIAAYFAVRGHPAGADGRIFAISGLPRATKKDGPFGQSTVGLVRPNAVAGRIVSQQGLFTVSPIPYEAIDSDETVLLDHIDIPAEEKQWLQRRLSRIGFDPASVMMDLDGLCRSIDEAAALSWIIDFFS